MNYLTPYSELNDVLRDLLNSLSRVLMDNFFGLYLQGSLATGGFDQDSDVDFIVVSERDLSATKVASLQSVHQQLFDLPTEWAKHLEGSYFPTAVLRESANCGQDVWYLEHGKNYLARSPHCNTVVVRWILRERPVVLFGPEPTTLIDPISTDQLRRSIHQDIKEWGEEILDGPDRFENRFYQSFIVLNLCRMLRDLQMGEIGSKRLGTEWATTNLGADWEGLIDRAWDGRPNPAVSFRQPADKHEFELTLAFVREVIAQGNRIASDVGIC